MTLCKVARCKRRAADDGWCKTHATQQRDRAFSVMIRERDKWCRRCGTPTNLQCAHVVSRRYRETRWNPQNALTLCRSCHMWQTNHPLEGDVFFASLGIDVHALRMQALGKEAS